MIQSEVASPAQLLSAVLRAWEALEPEDQAALSLHAPAVYFAIRKAREVCEGTWLNRTEALLGAIARSRP